MLRDSPTADELAQSQRPAAVPLPPAFEFRPRSYLLRSGTQRCSKRPGQSTGHAGGSPDVESPAHKRRRRPRRPRETAQRSSSGLQRRPRAAAGQSPRTATGADPQPLGMRSCRELGRNLVGPRDGRGPFFGFGASAEAEPSQGRRACQQQSPRRLPFLQFFRLKERRRRRCVDWGSGYSAAALSRCLSLATS